MYQVFWRQLIAALLIVSITSVWSGSFSKLVFSFVIVDSRRLFGSCYMNVDRETGIFETPNIIPVYARSLSLAMFL